MSTKLTDQEYENALMATPAGQSALQASQKAIRGGLLEGSGT